MRFGVSERDGRRERVEESVYEFVGLWMKRCWSGWVDGNKSRRLFD